MNLSKTPVKINSDYQKKLMAIPAFNEVLCTYRVQFLTLSNTGVRNLYNDYSFETIIKLEILVCTIVLPVILMYMLQNANVLDF